VDCYNLPKGDPERAALPGTGRILTRAERIGSVVGFLDGSIFGRQFASLSKDQSVFAEFPNLDDPHVQFMMLDDIIQSGEAIVPHRTDKIYPGDEKVYVINIDEPSPSGLSENVHICPLADVPSP
jgi:hypothetical protein